MIQIFLIKNPILFQGEKYLGKKKNYFEGWYFKNIYNDNGISFIPGISINNLEKRAFIQIITVNSSYFVEYDIKDFIFNDEPFYIKIGNSFFSKEKIHIDINDEKKKIKVYGEIRYTDIKNIDTSFLDLI